MKFEELQGKKILVVGYGIEGKATEQFLRYHFPNVNIGIVDQKNGSAYLVKQEEYDLAIKSPGVKAELLTILYTTATNIFFANAKGITIGITGSKGKSTTASLIYEILKASGKKVHLVGNIGKPALAELLKTNGEDDIWVYELSSFQLAGCNYSPHISVITNLFPEHMDYHGSIENYYDAKKRILAKAKSTDYFVYNPNISKLQELANGAGIKAIPFVDELPFDEKEIPLLGEHNKENVAAAVTVANILHIANEDIQQAVKNFKPLAHRLQLVGTYKDITFYDDAISTIPESTIAAIKSLKNIGTIFLGGQDRGYDFSLLAGTVKQHKIPNIVLFPDSGKKIQTLLTKDAINIFETDNMEEAVKWAYEHTPAGTICLLSCASPSFSLWKNYEEKGDLFQKFVKEYGR